jgi:hypothetical protein
MFSVTILSSSQLCFALSQILETSKSVTLPVWLVRVLLPVGAEVPSSLGLSPLDEAVYPCYAGSAADGLPNNAKLHSNGSELLKVYLRHGRPVEAAQVALSLLAAADTDLLCPPANQPTRTPLVCLPMTIIDMVFVSLDAAADAGHPAATAAAPASLTSAAAPALAAPAPARSTIPALREALRQALLQYFGQSLPNRDARRAAEATAKAVHLPAARSAKT